MQYFKLLYAPKFDSLDELNQFLERYNLPTVVEEKKNLYRPISMKEIESITNY